MSGSDIVKRLEQGIKAASFNDWDFERTEADMQEGADTITALRAEVKRLKAGYTATQHVIQQTLGKALGYPWFKDDQKNFPGATEADGVCVGDHVAESLADEAAAKITALRAKIEKLEGALEDIADGLGETDLAEVGRYAKHIARAALGDTHE